jgi:hypothetical protein
VRGGVRGRGVAEAVEQRPEAAAILGEVAGLQLTITASRPDSRTVIAACTQQ